MRITPDEARQYLHLHAELLEEMILHRQKKVPDEDEEGLLIEEDVKIISQYRRLKTFELEKKMGLIK